MTPMMKNPNLKRTIQTRGKHPEFISSIILMSQITLAISFLTRPLTQHVELFLENQKKTDFSVKQTSNCAPYSKPRISQEKPSDTQSNRRVNFRPRHTHCSWSCFIHFGSDIILLVIFGKLKTRTLVEEE